MLKTNKILAVLVLAGASVNAQTYTSEDWQYTISNGEATITGYTGSGGAVAIPSDVDGVPVKKVGNEWPPIFGYKNSSITSVTIPNSVTSIGYGAFANCTSLTNVTIPNSVTSIGDVAFLGCTSLTNVTIPNSVTSIGGSAFRGCPSLTSINIPNSVTSIGAAAFWGCTSLTSINIPNSVTSIGVNAFYYCTSLTSINIPNSVTSIGDSAFANCTSLTSVTIPNSVTSIGDVAFYNCTSLTSVTIPNSVTSIGLSAFQGCSRLTSVTIPNSVTSIGASAFFGCTSLVTVYLPALFADTYTGFGLTTSQVSFYGPGDDDGDGQTNLDEIIAGTDPLNPNSRLAIDTIVATPGGVILTWTAISGRKYTVEACQDLSNGTWASVATGLTTGSYTDSSSLVPKKFYRLGVE